MKLQVLVHRVDVVEDVSGNSRNNSHQVRVMQVPLESYDSHVCIYAYTYTHTHTYIYIGYNIYVSQTAYIGLFLLQSNQTPGNICRYILDLFYSIFVVQSD